MNKEIGWHFPPSNGGREDGYNDSGIATFKGSPFPSLARETIQNSLDAAQDRDKPVMVSFDLIDVSREDIGADELSAVVDACLSEVGEDDTVARSALEKSQEILMKNKITCLRISDRNTTGLNGDLWRSLVKMQGVSVKPNVLGAGGSHGIGKSAPFVVSTLRTVLYWTCYKESDEYIEKFQGKSILMSHENDEGRTQGAGFYGYKDGCLEIRGQFIPDQFRVLGKKDIPVEGTSLIVIGFQPTVDWRRQISVGVIENFFYAISNNNLIVSIEQNESMKSNGLKEINQGNLERWFDHLDDQSDTNRLSEEEDSLRQARAFWNITRDKNITPIDRQDTTFGHCRLWILVDEGLSRVGLIRSSGMLITTEQANLKRFPRYNDFVALCVFEDPEGNDLLRLMENPQHDQFEPSRLPEELQEKGRRGLDNITSWIRKQIRKIAGPPEGGKATVLKELATLLPDIYPDEDFDHYEEGDKEQGFGDRVVVRLKPIRRSLPSSLTENGNGEVEWNDDGEGGSGGDGDGEGGNGTVEEGGEGGKRAKRAVPISSVRILPTNNDDRLLKFTAGENAVVELRLEEIGDSAFTARNDIRPVDDKSFKNFELSEGKRHSIVITSNVSMENRSWRLLAIEIEKEQE